LGIFDRLFGNKKKHSKVSLTQIDIDDLDEFNGLLHYNNKPFTGTYFEELDDRIEFCHCKEGLRNGPFKAVFKNGKTANELNFKKGKKDGLARGYYENGILKYELYFKNDEFDNYIKKFNDSGKLISEIQIKNGIEHGEIKSYNDNGVLVFKGQAINGFLEGVCKNYYETGELQSEIEYLEDKKDGKSLSYYKNGNLEGSGFYKYGYEVGLWKKFNEVDGNLEHQVDLGGEKGFFKIIDESKYLQVWGVLSSLMSFNVSENDVDLVIYRTELRNYIHSKKVNEIEKGVFEIENNNGEKFKGTVVKLVKMQNEGEDIFELNFTDNEWYVNDGEEIEHIPNEEPYHIKWRSEIFFPTITKAIDYIKEDLKEAKNDY
jgi:antitoxin component YwqK of YwqJK toxin-antitoxin module